MKRIILSTAALLVVSGTMAFAQQSAPGQQAAAPMRHHHQRDPHREAEHLSKKLNLTPDQTAKLEPIFAERNQKMRDLHAKTSLSPEDMHQQQHAIMKSTHDQLAGVLTPDQLQQMRAMRHENMQRQDQTQPNPAPPSSM